MIGILDKIRSECETEEEWNEILNENEALKNIHKKWELYLGEVKKLCIIPYLPFTEDEINYINSEIIDGLKIVGGELPHRAFNRACDNGKIELAKWLVSFGVDIHTRDDWAFNMACSNGHLELAKWLVSLGVNPRMYDDWMFRNACFYGQLDIAKWLYSLGANPRTKDALKWAQINRYTHIVDWLKSVN